MRQNRPCARLLTSHNHASRGCRGKSCPFKYNITQRKGNIKTPKRKKCVFCVKVNSQSKFHSVQGTEISMKKVEVSMRKSEEKALKSKNNSNFWEKEHDKKA